MKSRIYTTFKTLIIALAITIATSNSLLKAQVTGLDNWTLYIDQGHSQFENMGVYGYSEAEKVLRVGLALREYLLDKTDIEAVYVTRETDADFVTLGGRVDEANTLATDFYYSIHSDAGPPEVNRTLFLYGGWRSNGVTVEKTPNGGAEFGNILTIDLTGAMRIPTIGNFADRVFYDGLVHHHSNQFPSLWVNRQTIMASLLSEGGFHTNPTQNQRNMNAEWKKMEALAAFWTILEYNEVEKPEIGVALGYITDAETGKPLNGVTVEINGQTYTTDTFESLFHQYSNDPEQLSNGFYFFEDLEPQETYDVSFTSPHYLTHETTLTIASNINGAIAENLSFLDVSLISTAAPVVTEVQTPGNLDDLLPGTPITVRFSRKMNKPTVEAAVSIEPEANLTLTWSNDFNLVINTSQLEYLTDYTITIDGSIAQNILTEQFLDGNGDGEEGGNYVINITTSEEDLDPPVLLSFYPSPQEPANTFRPIIRLVYDEEIIASSVGENAITLAPAAGGTNVPGIIQNTLVFNQSVLHFFPTEDLDPNITYRVNIEGGLSDVFDNQTEPYQFSFSLYAPVVTNVTVIDNFNGGIVNWWNPQEAGQTTGIVTFNTRRVLDTSIVNHATGSTGSMRLDYEWEEGFAGTPYIRQYLPPTATQNTIRFNKEDVLQFYLFGDGTGNELRLMIRDGLNELEGSTWIPIDWKGWKLISWDLTNDPVFGWVTGNGVLEGSNFYIDGFHLRKAANAKLLGSLNFDDLRFVRQNAVSVSEIAEVNVRVYPNPANNQITISAYEELVNIELFSIDGKNLLRMEPHQVNTTINVSSLERGTYIVRVQTKSGQTRSFLQIIN